MHAPEHAPLLIVEDDPTIRELVGRTLRLAGHEVVLADSGESVVELVLAHEPRLVVMDLAMPGPSGLEALRALRARGLQVPVIVLTGRGRDDDKLAAFDAGAQDYLVKPISGSELLARIASVLRRARLSNQNGEG